MHIAEDLKDGLYGLCHGFFVDFVKTLHYMRRQRYWTKIVRTSRIIFLLGTGTTIDVSNNVS